MDDWLKNKPTLQLLLSGAITLVGLLIMFFLTTSADNSKSVTEDIQTLKVEKATYSYVDSKNGQQDRKIEEKADKSLVESMDSKLDLILTRLK
jgi:hypothetical protein